MNKKEPISTEKIILLGIIWGTVSVEIAIRLGGLNGGLFMFFAGLALPVYFYLLERNRE